MIRKKAKFIAENEVTGGKEFVIQMSNPKQKKKKKSKIPENQNENGFGLERILSQENIFVKVVFKRGKMYSKKLIQTCHNGNI